MGRLVEIKLCPLRSCTDPFTDNEKVEECFEEKCMLYNSEYKCCGLNISLLLDNKKKD